MHTFLLFYVRNGPQLQAALHTLIGGPSISTPSISPNLEYWQISRFSVSSQEYSLELL